MSKLKELVSKLRDYQNKENDLKVVKDNDTEALEERLNQKYNSYCSSIERYLSSPGLTKIIDLLCKYNSTKLFYDPNKKVFRLNGISNLILQFTYKNVSDVANKERADLNLINSTKNLCDLGFLKVFCTAYNTLRAISEASDVLADQELVETTSQLRKSADKLQKEFDSLGDINKLKAEIKKELDVPIGESLDNEILVGLTNSDLTSDDIALLKANFEGKINAGYSPVKLSPFEGMGNLFVDVDIDGDDLDWGKYLSSIYFKFLQKQSDILVKFAAIEYNEFSKTPLNVMHKKVYGEAPFLCYNAYVGVERKGNEYFEQVINSILEEKKQRKTVFENCSSLEEYNNKNAYAKKDYIFLVVNGFDKIFTSESSRKLLENLMKDSYMYGIFVLIFGHNTLIKGKYDDNINPLNLCNAQCREIKLSTLDTSYLDLDEEEIEFIISKKNKTRNAASIMYTSDMLELTKDKKEPFIDGVSVPVGISNGKIFNFDLKAGTKPGVLITGTTRCGKTSFLHTFLLSSCSRYSPDEIEFYLVDYKSSQSVTFSYYEKGSAFDYLYMPNIKYLSLVNSHDNALDLIKMINSKFDERSRLFSKYGVDKLATYNKKMIEIGEKTLPIAVFIIDEYQNLISSEQRSTDFSNDVVQQIHDLLTKVASHGIKLIFSGVGNVFKKDTVSLIQTKIIFDMGDKTQAENVFSSVFGETFLLHNQNIYETELQGKVGYALFDVGTGSPVVMRSAYSGDTSESYDCGPALIAKSINEKYKKDGTFDKYVQLVSGKDKSFETPQSLKVDGSHDLKLPIGLSRYTYYQETLNFSLANRFIFMEKDEYHRNNDRVLSLEKVLIKSFIDNTINGEVFYGTFDDKENDLISDFNDPRLVKIYAGCGEQRAVKVLQIATKIVELAKILKRRKTMRGIDKEYMLILHDVTDLNLLNDYIDCLSDIDIKPKTQVEIVDDFPSYEKTLEKKPDLSLEHYNRLHALHLEKLRAQAEAANNALTSTFDTSSLSLPIVREALRDIFTIGNEYGVYCVLSARSLKGADDFIDTITGVRDIKSMRSNERFIVSAKTINGEDAEHNIIVYPSTFIMPYDGNFRR